jgi:ubiquinone/menaquinone biosynthesis C-methylase UbiE
VLTSSDKDWDRHVVDAEEVARGAGFLGLRDQILALAQPRAGEVAVDVGAGTGLLALELAQAGVETWAIDISPAMCAYLETKAASAGIEGLRVGVASAVSLPLVSGIADLVVSNYCFHHLRDEDKLRALQEARRVLKPGGRLVFGDMMFALALGDPRDRDVVLTKVRSIGSRGPAGIARLARNAARIATGRWEHPARAPWWEQALLQAGFQDVEVQTLAHEGGVARARRP